ncbi:MAG TPA: lamin tail domain-containing protein, partial [Verrucomicrobiae bacterium]
MKPELLQSRKFSVDTLRSKIALLIGCLMLVAGSVHAQPVAELTDIGSTNPVAGPMDISQFSTAGNGLFPDSLVYYTSDQIAYGNGEPGQTFETGANPIGYTVTSLAIKTGGLDQYNGIETSQTYLLHFYAVNNNNAVLVASYISEPFAFTDGDWLRWTGISVPMAPNSPYAYSFGLSPGGTGFEPLAVCSDQAYTNGELGLFPPAGGAITFGHTQQFDGVFDIELINGGLPGLTQFSVSPANNVFIGTAVTFNTSVVGTQPLFLQWQFNGGTGFANIPGADSNSISLIAELTNSGPYQLIVTNIYGAITSAPITLTVTRDTTPPTIVQSQVLGTTNVELVFSKPLEIASATNIANYVCDQGLSVISATLETNGNTVLLSTGVLTIGSYYTLVINGVRDQAVPPNTIATNTSVNFIVSPFTSIDIGGAPIATTVTTISFSSAVVTSDGKAIGSTADQFGFNYQIESGNFDMALRVGGMEVPNVFAQAGLMGRASLAGGSPYAAALASPGVNGDSFSYRGTTNGAAAVSGHFPVNYPNTWLRLSRSGNVFTGFGSYDGTNWTQLGSATIAMPSQIYVGLALASGSANAPVTASFGNFGATPAGAALATQTNPNEPLGPSSRTTGIAISEIMWKPAARADSNDVEFIELYNSCPFFQDISSYTVKCADMSYTFAPNTTIGAGQFFVLAASPPAIAGVYGLTSNVFGYTGSLKHSETLRLLDERSNVLLTVPYTDVYPWPVAAGGTGHSLVLANPTYGEGDPRAWAISDHAGGSPGQMDSFTPSPLRSVVINEILA